VQQVTAPSVIIRLGGAPEDLLKEVFVHTFCSSSDVCKYDSDHMGGPGLSYDEDLVFCA
jgi:hypothetical protein